MPVSRQTAEGLSAEVQAIYARVETRLLRLIADRLADGLDSPRWAEDKLQEVQVLRLRAQRELRQALADAAGASGAALRGAFVRGQAAAQADLDAAGIRLDGPVTHPERSVEALLRDQVDRFNIMGQQVLRGFEDAYRQAVRQAVAGTLTGAATRLQDAQVALDDLARQGIHGFVDTAGRRWDMASYTEMATRTATARASVLGHIDRLGQAGINLLIVSDSPRECELCRPWEGAILTTGGAVTTISANPATGERVAVQPDGSVEQATADGLFHPNCTHSLSAYLPGVTSRPTGTANPSGYQARQDLRHLERQVRAWKKRAAVAVTPEAKAKAKAKVRDWTGQIEQHTAANPGLLRQRNREGISRAR